jgi:hypothetical protein
MLWKPVGGSVLLPQDDSVVDFKMGQPLQHLTPGEEAHPLKCCGGSNDLSGTYSGGPEIDDLSDSGSIGVLPCAKLSSSGDLRRSLSLFVRVVGEGGDVRAD